jgi:putative Mg2+ transporter-C (MgtC) family protein
LPDIPGLTATDLGLDVLAARIVIAAFLGGALGIERERRDRPAGLRTYMLTSLAAALFTVVTIEMSESLSEKDRIVADPLRVVQAVTAGVAFLAAGTIVSRKGEVKGLTTGAGMWMAGAIGVACGTGYYAAALITTALTLFILVVLRQLEKRALKSHHRDDG